MQHDLTQENEFPRKYLQFPLFLLPRLFTQKEDTLNKILRYGIYRMSKSMKYDLPNVARQIIYENYRGDLTSEIRQHLYRYELEHFGQDEDYNGFSGDTFEPTDELSELLTLFKKNKQLKDLCIEFYCIRQSMQVLGIKGNIEYIAKCAKEIEKQIKGKEIMPMIGKHLLFHFRDNNKSESDIAQLVAYTAIRSIIGEKAYVKTNKEHITARMFGYASSRETQEIVLSDLHKKYLNRYHIDKTLQALQLDWNVCLYSNKMRGFYVSISNKTPLEKLAIIAEQQKKSNRIKELNETKRAIIKNISK